MPGKGRGLRTLTGTLFQIAFLPIQFLPKLLSFLIQLKVFSGGVAMLMEAEADVRLPLYRGTTGSMGPQGCALAVKAMELSRDRPRHPLHFLTSLVARSQAAGALRSRNCRKSHKSGDFLNIR